MGRFKHRGEASGARRVIDGIPSIPSGARRAIDGIPFPSRERERDREREREREGAKTGDAAVILPEVRRRGKR